MKTVNQYIDKIFTQSSKITVEFIMYKLEHGWMCVHVGHVHISVLFSVMMGFSISGNPNPIAVCILGDGRQRERDGYFCEC